ncbi:DUF397 domain-containing protein [Actinomadura terrae]|uniref:DUF397 domain-containing protein n=1 Tax=Actinomadura terrae TaxID=604353 RepID=UPI001FA7BA48|nr:DUF397 domain-containing protein [Actinomadura terrae]
MTAPVWRKSSHSGTGDQSVCVEVASLHPQVGVRDSENPDEGHLVLSPQAFASLLSQAKRGDLSL